MSGLDRFADPGRAPSRGEVRPETVRRGLVAATAVLWAAAMVAQTALLAAGQQVDGTDLLVAALLLAVVTAAAALAQLFHSTRAIAAQAVVATLLRLEEDANEIRRSLAEQEGVTRLRPRP